MGIVLFIALVLLFIRSPWGQDIIVDKAVSYISNKTNTKVAVKKLFITFDGGIKLDGLYLEYPKGDTLVFSRSLEANVPLWSIITGKGIGVDALNWEGLRANIIRKDSLAGYNFQFLIDAFAPIDSAAVKTDTVAAPLNLVLGTLNFKDFDVVFNDAVAGIDSRFKIGNLSASMRKTDLEQMLFEASDLELKNTNINFVQKPVTKNPNPEPTAPLPTLTVDHLILAHVYANYQLDTDRIAGTLDIKDLYTEIPNINLANNVFEIDAFHLKKSTIVIRTETETEAIENTKKTPSVVKKDPSGFKWPDVTLAVGSIDFQHNHFSYFVGNNRAKKGNYSAIIGKKGF